MSQAFVSDAVARKLRKRRWYLFGDLVGLARFAEESLGRKRRPEIRKVSGIGHVRGTRGARPTRFIIRGFAQ